MVAPFFAYGHLLAVATGASANGFSLPYQATAAAAGLTYALLGLLVLGTFLTRWFSRGTVVLTLLATTLGTNLFHYATYDAVFSHAFSFFLVACALQLAVVVRDRPTPRLALAVGLVAGLVTAVRPTNAVVLVFAALIGVVNRADAFERVKALRHYARLVAVGIAGFALPLVPQIVYWHEITGRWLIYSYGDEHLDLWHPHVIQVLFSVRKGLFFWTPLLLLAVFGLVFVRRRAPDLFIPAVAFLAIDTWAISSWQIWWYGGSFGQRPFVEAMPVFALGLAALIDSVRGRIARRATLVAVLILTGLAVHSMIDYWLGIVPFDGTTWHQYVDSFTRL